MKMKAILTVALSCAVLLFSCANPFNTMNGPGKGAGYGRVSVNFEGDNGRTVYPAMAGLHYVYTFAHNGGAGQAKTPENGVFSLEPGNWTVQVDAYAEAAHTTKVAWSDATPFTLTSGQTQSITIKLQGTEETGTGKFTYYITYPAGTTVTELSLKKIPGFTDVTLPAAAATSASGTDISVGAGFYLFTVRLTKDGKEAGINEVVHIYKDLTSEYGTSAAPVVFNDGSFITPVGTGNYTSLDVLGNSYSLYVGTDVAAGRSARPHDRYRMNIKTRDGKVRYVEGTITDIGADGTLTLDPDDVTADEFIAVVDSDGGDLSSVVGENIPFEGAGDAEDLVITPRTFSDIQLRATRWENDNGKERGENWGTGNSVLVNDFATNVSNLTTTANQYTITVSGTSNVKIEWPAIEIQGINDAGEWTYFGGASNITQTINANSPFEITATLNINGSYNLLDYKEVVMNLTNLINYENDDEPTWAVDNGTIPAEIDDGTIMATISDFKVSLKDTTKEALAGNMEDYHFGYAEDGLSIDYRQAVWSLSADNVTEAKKPGAKFEFFVTDIDGYNDAFGEDGPTLAFIWQDPVRGLWWQDMSHVSGGTEESNYTEYALGEGVTWEAWRNKISIDLGTVIKDNQFASATELNFIVACWWNGNDWNDDDYRGSVGEIGIAGANIAKGHPATTGNMGNYRYGDKETVETVYDDDGNITTPGSGDYYLIDYSQAVWNLGEAVADAKETDAKLVIVFNKDMETVGPALGLAWSDVENQDYWVESTTKIYSYDNDQQKMVWGTEATWHSATKTLTIDLSAAFSELGDSASGNIEFTLASFYDKNSATPTWGITNINELGIVSANIVTGSGAGGFGAQSDGSYTLDPAGWEEWYGATGFGTDTIAFTEGGVKYAYPEDFDITDYTSLEIAYKITVYTEGTDAKKDGGVALVIKTYNAALTESYPGANVKYSNLGQNDPSETYIANLTTLPVSGTLTIDDQYNTDNKSFADWWHNTSTDNASADDIGFAIAVNANDTNATFTIEFESITFRP